MPACPACRESLPTDAVFCGICGFRLTPLAQTDEPIPLTKVKSLGHRVPGAATDDDRPTVPFIRESEPLTKHKRLPTPGPSDDTRLEMPGLLPKARAPRFPLKIEVDYQSEHNFYTGFLENISAGGLFIATHDLRPVGEILEVTFTVPGLQKPVIALCRVRWLREYDENNQDAPPGLGCQFAPLEDDVRKAVDAFIRHREPIFYDD